MNCISTNKCQYSNPEQSLRRIQTFILVFKYLESGSCIPSPGQINVEHPEFIDKNDELILLE